MADCAHSFQINDGDKVIARYPCTMSGSHVFFHFNEQTSIHWKINEEGTYKVIPHGAMTMLDPNVINAVYQDVIGGKPFTQCNHCKDWFEDIELHVAETVSVNGSGPA